MVESEQHRSVESLPDERILPDRRRRPTPILSRYTLNGRRTIIRRKEDKERHLYVDRYGNRLFLMLVAILVLGTADAFLTLYHVNVNGAVEMNPIMDFFLGKSPNVFFHVKYVLTALCLLVLCLHKNLPVVKYVLGSVLVIYLLIVINHIYLFFVIP